MEKFIDSSFILDEMKEEMDKTVDNVLKVKESIIKLNNILKESEDKDFEILIKENENNLKNYDEQIKILRYRISCIDKILNELLVHGKDETYKSILYVINLVLESFGISNKDAKTIEERIKNNERVIK